MEFEKNVAATAEEIALADAPRMTVRPAHGDMVAEQTDTELSRANQRVFSFESESTAIAAAPQSATNHHRVALIATVTVITVFIGALAFTFIGLR